MTNLFPAAGARYRLGDVPVRLSRLDVLVDPTTSARRIPLSAMVTLLATIRVPVPPVVPPRTAPPEFTVTAPFTVPVPARVPPALAATADPDASDPPVPTA